MTTIRVVTVSEIGETEHRFEGLDLNVYGNALVLEYRLPGDYDPQVGFREPTIVIEHAWAAGHWASAHVVPEPNPE